MRHEPVFRADAVDWQLQRTRAIRRPAQFVVDDPKRAICEQIHAVGLPAQRDDPRSTRGVNSEGAVEPVLEQPLDHGNGTLGLHAEDRLAKAGCRRGSEQPGTFQTGFRGRQALERPVHDVREQVTREIQVVRGDRAMPSLLPRVEKLLEHLVDEDSLSPWIHHLFVVRFLFEREDVAGKELERAIEIRLERAHRPAGRRGRIRSTARAQGAVEFRRIGG